MRKIIYAFIAAFVVVLYGYGIIISQEKNELQKKLDALSYQETCYDMFSAIKTVYGTDGISDLSGGEPEREVLNKLYQAAVFRSKARIQSVNDKKQKELKK